MLTASWLYVWGAYGLTFLILFITWGLAVRRHRLAQRRLERRRKP